MSSITNVIEGGYCIGCGACAFVRPDRFQMNMSEEGMWVAVENAAPALADPFFEPSPVSDIVSDDLGAVICPMSGEAADETAIASGLYPDLPADTAIGRYRRNVVGHVTKGDFRAIGGSGGLVTWLLDELMARDEIDGVLHVRPVEREDDGVLFEYSISDSREQIVSAAKSRYYPIETSGVLALLTQNNKRYAFVGVPCFVKAVRLLQISRAIPEDRVRYCIGLVCGHLKSRYFAEYLAWQKGIAPNTLAAIDFRYKLLDKPASQYGFSVRKRGSDQAEIHPMSSVRGRDWGEGMFKNPACEFCDDVLAECADIAVGDAWLPGYVDDPRGSNVAVIRNDTIDRILLEAQKRAELVLDEVTPEQVAASQDAGLRHRRQGLSHRLARRKEAGRWIPEKRVPVKLADDPKRQRIYDLRLQIAEQGSRLFVAARRRGDLAAFERDMRPLISRYHHALKGGFTSRLLKKVRRLLISRR